jgi:hypothetical protein
MTIAGEKMNKIENFPTGAIDQQIAIDTELYYVCRIWVQSVYTSSIKITKDRSGYEAHLWLEHKNRDKEWTCRKSIVPVGTYEALKDKHYDNLEDCYNDNIALAKEKSVARYNEILANDLRR